MRTWKRPDAVILDFLEDIRALLNELMNYRPQDRQRGPVRCISVGTKIVQDNSILTLVVDLNPLL